jgi:hypothetical protein
MPEVSMSPIMDIPDSIFIPMFVSDFIFMLLSDPAEADRVKARVAPTMATPKTSVRGNKKRYV